MNTFTVLYFEVEVEFTVFHQTLAAFICSDESKEELCANIKTLNIGLLHFLHRLGRRAG